jgi:hypothetical protein
MHDSATTAILRAIFDETAYGKPDSMTDDVPISFEVLSPQTSPFSGITQWAAEQRRM